jgi:hypothetical protein
MAFSCNLSPFCHVNHHLWDYLVITALSWLWPFVLWCSVFWYMYIIPMFRQDIILSSSGYQSENVVTIYQNTRLYFLDVCNFDSHLHYRIVILKKWSFIWPRIFLTFMESRGFITAFPVLTHTVGLIPRVLFFRICVNFIVCQTSIPKTRSGSGWYTFLSGNSRVQIRSRRSALKFFVCDFVFHSMQIHDLSFLMIPLYFCITVCYWLNVLRRFKAILARSYLLSNRVVTQLGEYKIRNTFCYIFFSFFCTVVRYITSMGAK